MNPTGNFSIDSCLVNVDGHVIEFTDSQIEHLKPKSLEVLNYLALQYPLLVSREELIDEIWNQNFLVGEQSLTNTIWDLRQIFRKYMGEITVIDTVKTVGYKLTMAPVFESVEDTNSANKKYYSNTKLVLLLLLLSFLGTMLYYFKVPKIKFTKQKIESITTEPGRELFPALSKDEELLAFKWVRTNDTIDLYLKNLKQKSAPITRLTFTEEEEGPPIWSVNNDYIYYNKINRKTKTCQVVRLSLLNKFEDILAQCHFQKLTQISISPNGNFLVFLSPGVGTQPAPITLLDLKHPNNLPIKIICQHNCNYRNRDLAFSPDGKMLAVTRRVGKYSENIFVIDLSSNESTQVTFNFFNIVGLSWHPDNKRIFFGAQNSAFREGYMVTLASKKLENLGVEGFSFPEFSKNGEYLLFHYRKAKRHIASLSLDSGENASIFPLIISEFNHRHQDYSAVSNQIVYTSNESGYYELWLSDATGHKRKQITSLQKELESPVWSRDGSKIAFLAPSELLTENAIYILDIKTRRVTKLNSTFKSHGKPSWMLNDQGVLAASFDPNSPGLYLFGLDPDSTPKLIMVDGIYAQVNDDGLLAFTTNDKQIWTKPLISNDKAEQLIMDGKFHSSYLWKLTSDGVFFPSSEGNHYTISFYRFSDKKISLVAKVPWLTDDRFSAISIIPDESKLLLTIEDYPQANIKKLQHPLLIQ